MSNHTYLFLAGWLLSCVSPLAAQTDSNLLPNTSLTTWHASGNCPVFWGAWSPDDKRHLWRLNRDEEIFRDAPAAMRLENQYPVNVYSGHEVTAGRTYTMSAWIRSTQESKVVVFFSVWGQEGTVEKEQPEELRKEWTLPAGEWTRVHVTGVMPTGVERVTTYYSFRVPGTYHFDMAMLNEGELVDYTPGEFIKTVAPLHRPATATEVGFTPKLWDGRGREVDTTDVNFCFDNDNLSYMRDLIVDSNVGVGAEFSEPVRLRGLSLLLPEPTVSEEIELKLMKRRSGEWQEVAHKVTRYGAAIVVEGQPSRCEAVRLEFLPKEGKTVKPPRIFEMQFLP